MEDQWNLAINFWKNIVTGIKIDTAKAYMPGYAITREDYDGR